MKRLPPALRLASLLGVLLLASCHGPGSPADASKFPVPGHTYAAINRRASLPNLTLTQGKQRLLYQRCGIGPGAFFEPVVITGADVLRIEKRGDTDSTDFVLVPLKSGTARVQWRDRMHEESLSSFAIIVTGPRAPEVKAATACTSGDFTATWKALLTELDAPPLANTDEWPTHCVWLLDTGEEVFSQTPALTPADLRTFYDRFTGPHAAPRWLQVRIAASRAALTLLEPPPDLNATGARLESVAGDSLAPLPQPDADALARLYVFGAHARRSFIVTHEPEWLYYTGLAELATGNSPRLEWEDYLRLPGVSNRHRLNAKKWLETKAAPFETLPEHLASAEEPDTRSLPQP